MKSAVEHCGTKLQNKTKREVVMSLPVSCLYKNSQRRNQSQGGRNDVAFQTLNLMA